MNFRVGIEKKNPLAVDPLNRLIVGAAKAQILVVPDQIDLREPLGDGVGRSIPRGVVGDDHPHVQVRRIVEQGFETAQG